MNNKSHIINNRGTSTVLLSFLLFSLTPALQGNIALSEHQTIYKTQIKDNLSLQIDHTLQAPTEYTGHDIQKAIQFIQSFINTQVSPNRQINIMAFDLTFGRAPEHMQVTFQSKIFIVPLPANLYGMDRAWFESFLKIFGLNEVNPDGFEQGIQRIIYEPNTERNLSVILDQGKWLIAGLRELWFDNVIANRTWEQIQWLLTNEDVPGGILPKGTKLELHMNGATKIILDIGGRPKIWFIITISGNNVNVTR